MISLIVRCKSYYSFEITVKKNINVYKLLPSSFLTGFLVFLIFLLSMTTAYADTEPLKPLEAPKNLDEKKVKLGKRLFHDVRLSKDDSISCASCHELIEQNQGVLKLTPRENDSSGMVWVSFPYTQLAQ